MGRPQRYLPGFIAAVLALGACSSTPSTTTVEAAPLVTTTTEAPVTTTQQVTTTVAPTTTSTIDPNNPFLQYPGGELVGAPMPEFDQTAETYADLERWLTDFDTLWVWINANPELVTDEIIEEFFSGGMVDQAKRNRESSIDRGTRLLSGDHFMGEIREVIPRVPGHEIDTTLPQVLIGFEIITVQSEPFLSITETGEIALTSDGWTVPSAFLIQLQQVESAWQFHSVEYIGEAIQ